MTHIIYHDCMQGSAEWHKARCGKLTASVLSKILTPKKLELSSQADSLAMTVAAERIKGRHEESPTTFDIERGLELEYEARELYHDKISPVVRVGFIENTKLNFRFGASPDGILENEKGAIEIKCPRAKGHLDTLFYNTIDGGYILQMQGLMLASDLQFVDFISYHEGLKVKPIRVVRDEEIISKITSAGEAFEKRVQYFIDLYESIEGIATTMAEEISL